MKTFMNIFVESGDLKWNLLKITIVCFGNVSVLSSLFIARFLFQVLLVILSSLRIVDADQ